ncbi:hypothetical protein LZ31DRAFT_254850 [Colletotrichum somersetense]|nr:hypothetical protein LZ31DRAFT_254850 [Colletotrichum somersetense]
MTESSGFASKPPPPPPIPTSGPSPVSSVYARFEHMSNSPLLPSTLTRDGPRPSVSSRHAQLSPRVPPRLFFSFSVKTEPVNRHLRSSVNSLHRVSWVPVRFLRETTSSDAVTAPVAHTLGPLLSILRLPPPTSTGSIPNFIVSPPSLPIVVIRAAWNNEGPCPALRHPAAEVRPLGGARQSRGGAVVG